MVLNWQQKNEIQETFENFDVNFVATFDSQNRVLLVLLINENTNTEELVEYQYTFKNLVDRFLDTDSKITYRREMFNEKVDSLDILAEVE